MINIINKTMRLGLFILLFTVLAGCTINNANSEQGNIIENLEGNIETESNYYFFNESEKSKEITLNFKDNYKEEPIAKIELFYDGTMVTERVKVIDTSIHDSGIFNMELQQYIPKFNEIKLITQTGNELYLKTGLFEFEKITSLNNLPIKEQLVFEMYNSTENKNYYEFQSIYEYMENIKEENINILTPKQSIETLNLQTTMDLQKNDKTNINIKTTMQTSKTASYEMLIIQTDNKSGKTQQLNSIIVTTY